MRILMLLSSSGAKRLTHTATERHVSGRLHSRRMRFTAEMSNPRYTAVLHTHTVDNTRPRIDDKLYSLICCAIRNRLDIIKSRLAQRIFSAPISLQVGYNFRSPLASPPPIYCCLTTQNVC